MNGKLNLILIVVDALRPGNLGVYGYRRETSPNIDAIASRGIVFEEAFSTTNSTDPSITSILTGCYPITHGIRTHGTMLRREDVLAFTRRGMPLLQEILKIHGYHTYGVDWLGRWHKRGYDYYFGSERGVERGRKTGIPTLIERIIKKAKRSIPKFISYRLSRLRRIHRNLTCPYTASKLTDSALEILENVKEPFLLFIHYWNTHEPYTAPEKFITSLSLSRGSGEFAISSKSILAT